MVNVCNVRHAEQGAKCGHESSDTLDLSASGIKENRVNTMREKNIALKRDSKNILSRKKKYSTRLLQPEIKPRPALICSVWS